MTRMIPVLFVLFFSGCSKAGPTHWVDHKFLDRENPNLVCDSSGLIVASIMDDGGSWSVWGGNGAGYGSYQTEAQAKEQAESLVTSGWSFRMGNKWLICVPKENK